MPPKVLIDRFFKVVVDFLNKDPNCHNTLLSQTLDAKLNRICRYTFYENYAFAIQYERITFRDVLEFVGYHGDPIKRLISDQEFNDKFIQYLQENDVILYQCLTK
jgi:hypothetical protein